MCFANLLFIYWRKNQLQGEVDDFLESLTKVHHDKQEHEGIANRGLIHKVSSYFILNRLIILVNQ